MKLILQKENGRWGAKIIENGAVIVEVIAVEPRAGCAARMALNSLQRTHGAPSSNTVELTIEDW